MRIVVNHLTRMQPGYICVAGLDEVTGQHVRPCLNGARLRTSLLQERGGPSDIAAVVDLGFARHIGQPPETEDYLFEARRARRVPDFVNDGQFDVDVPVTDIRLYGTGHVTPAEERVRELDGRLQRGVKVVLAVGLSRPYTSSPDLPPIHWLQINGVHREDDPVWQLP
jgi:hypothetical protein